MLVITEQCRQIGAKCCARGAGQRGEVDNQIRLLRTGGGQCVTQQQAAFRVGVLNFHGKSLARAQDIARPKRIARHGVLCSGNEHPETNSKPSAHDHAGETKHMCGTTHVLLHEPHRRGRFQIEPPAVEAYALAHESNPWLGGILIAPSEVDELRRLDARTSHRVDRGIVLLQQVLAHDLADLRLVLGTERLGGLSELLGHQIARRCVHQVPHQVYGFGHIVDILCIAGGVDD